MYAVRKKAKNRHYLGHSSVSVKPQKKIKKKQRSREMSFLMHNKHDNNKMTFEVFGESLKTVTRLYRIYKCYGDVKVPNEKLLKYALEI